jgi:protein-tyrosine phosphatase
LGGIALVDAEHLHLPTFDTTRPMLDDADIVESLITAPDAYMSMLERGADAYATALRRIAGSDSPVVFFCAAGKDRTGVFAAFVLGLLGVSDDDIVADYALTGEVIEKIHARRSEHAPADAATMEAAMQRIGQDLAHAYPESMAVTIERVNATLGGWTGYASAIGVEPAVVDELRSRLLA